MLKRSVDGPTMKGFKQFLLRGNAVDLAVGVVIGAAFGKIVNSMVKGLLTPFLGTYPTAVCCGRIFSLATEGNQWSDDVWG